VSALRRNTKWRRMALQDVPQQQENKTNKNNNKKITPTKTTTRK
jgi:hypothetical protein